MMMVYPEEPFWALPTIPGLYDDGDYRGKLSYVNSTIIKNMQ